MNTNIIEIIKPLVDAASQNPYVAAGLVAGGILIAVGTWIYNKRQKK